jgi:hypothetical protein
MRLLVQLVQLVRIYFIKIWKTSENRVAEASTVRIRLSHALINFIDYPPQPFPCMNKHIYVCGVRGGGGGYKKEYKPAPKTIKS